MLLLGIEPIELKLVFFFKLVYGFIVSGVSLTAGNGGLNSGRFSGVKVDFLSLEFLVVSDVLRLRG